MTIGGGVVNAAPYTYIYVYIYILYIYIYTYTYVYPSRPSKHGVLVQAQRGTFVGAAFIFDPFQTRGSVCQEPEEAALPKQPQGVVNLTFICRLLARLWLRNVDSENELRTITMCFKHRRVSQASSTMNAPRKSMWLKVMLRTDLSQSKA